jgi:photosystem II stability/assembly factor-like uncharacterized protein
VYYYFGYLDEFLIHPANPLTVFACGAYGVFRKLDGSNKETDWYQTEMGDPCSAMCIPPSEPDTIYSWVMYFEDDEDEEGEGKVAKSTDAGDSWDEFFDAPNEFLSMKADPFNPDVLYAGGVNRGVFKTLDGSQTWEPINNGIKANSIFSTDISPDNSSTILCGTLAGVYITSDNQTWKLINDLIGYDVYFHPENKNIIYAGFSWEIGKSTDGGKSWSYLNISESYETHRVAAIAVSPGSPDTIFAGVFFYSSERGEIVKITDDSSKNFSESSFESVLVTDTPVNAVTVHPSNSDIVFVGTGAFYNIKKPGSLYVSRDSGKTWSQTSLQDVVVNSISISPTSPDIMYAACGESGTAYSGIYKSTDGGTTWESKIRGLPKYFSVSDIQVDESDSNIVYAALYEGIDDESNNLAGIYVTLDGGEYWTQIGLSDYLPYDVNSNVTDLKEPSKKIKSSQRTEISFPSSTVLAGTASGLYKTTTAGNGVITGNIIEQERGEMIDGAIVSSSFGSTCISEEGYYLLLVPSGVHRIQVQATGYTQASFPAATVSARQGVTQDITVTPVTDNGTCLASEVLSGTSHQKKLPLLRGFRDRVLKKTPLGKRLASLYYTLGEDVWKVLQKNPSLKKRCAKLMLKSIPIIESSLSGKRPRVAPSLLNELSQFLSDLEQSSPERLRKEINKLRNEMKSFSFKEILAK